MATRNFHKQINKSYSTSIPLSNPVKAILIALIFSLLYVHFYEGSLLKRITESKDRVAGWMSSFTKGLDHTPAKPDFSSGFEITPQPTQSAVIPTIMITQKIEINYQQQNHYPIPTTAFNYKYVYPTYVYPTIKPGDPGSKEWNDEFWKKWEEMSKSNADAQKAVEEAQKVFCQENPDLCKR